MFVSWTDFWLTPLYDRAIFNQINWIFRIWVFNQIYWLQDLSPLVWYSIVWYRSRTSFKSELWFCLTGMILLQGLYNNRLLIFYLLFNELIRLYLLNLPRIFKSLNYDFIRQIQELLPAGLHIIILQWFPINEFIEDLKSLDMVYFGINRGRLRIFFSKWTFLYPELAVFRNSFRPVTCNDSCPICFEEGQTGWIEFNCGLPDDRHKCCGNCFIKIFPNSTICPLCRENLI